MSRGEGEGVKNGSKSGVGKLAMAFFCCILIGQQVESDAFCSSLMLLSFTLTLTPSLPIAIAPVFIS